LFDAALLDGIAGAWSTNSSFIAYLEGKLRGCGEVVAVCHSAIDGADGLFVVIAFYRA
jgi:hypothetical protein